MGERSRRRVRDLVAQLAFEGRSQNETERARISMMARSDLLHARAGYRSARPTTVLKIQLATHGRSIQMGQRRRSRPVLQMSAYPPTAAEWQTFREGRLGPIADIVPIVDIKAHRAPFSSSERGEQAARGKKVNRFEAFGKPVVKPFQQLDG